MKKKRRILIFTNICMFLLTFTFSMKIVDYHAIGNWIIYRISGQPTCKDCNVILISLDTLSANHLPCYGYERNTAPNLCKFGKDNIFFSNAYSNANYTLPSHVSIFTGLYPSQHKVNGSKDNYLPPNAPFLPEILHQNGYKTLFYMPTEDQHLPISLVYYRGIDRIVNSYHPYLDWFDGLKQLKKNSDKGQKTFLFLHTYWVHAPYILENKDRKLYAKNDSGYNLPETYDEILSCTLPFIKNLKKTLEIDFDIGTFATDAKLMTIHKDLYKRLIEAIDNGDELKFCNSDENKGLLDTYHRAFYGTMIDKNDPKAIAHQLNLYDSKIVELDEYLKKVFDFVKSKNLKNKTIIIVTSDHGEEFMEHGAFGHGYNLYDTTLKVPMILSVPGVSNTQIEKLYQSVDILPTLLDILNIKTKAMFAGANIFESLTFPQKNYSEAQFLNEGSIRDEKWKILYKNSSSDGKVIGTEIYEYRQDPHETSNLLYKNPQIQNDLFMNLSK